MFARLVEFRLICERSEALEAFQSHVVPLLREQPGFIDVVPLFAEIRPDEGIAISLWDSPAHVDHYEQTVFPRAFELMKPYVTMRSVARFHLEPGFSVLFDNHSSAGFARDPGSRLA